VVADASTARFTVKDKAVLTVHGTLPITSGSIDLTVDQRVESATVELDASRIDTANTRRDHDLAKPRFLDTTAHPTVVVSAQSTSTRPDGWGLVATLAARQANAPLDLDASLAGDDGEAVRVHVTGRFDRQPLGIRVPSLVIGRYLDLDVDLVLVPDA
jgi:polyisoprenoid-binding protein YceI